MSIHSTQRPHSVNSATTKAASGRTIATTLVT